MTASAAAVAVPIRPSLARPHALSSGANITDCSRYGVATARRPRCPDPHHGQVAAVVPDGREPAEQAHVPEAHDDARRDVDDLEDPADGGRRSHACPTTSAPRQVADDVEQRRDDDDLAEALSPAVLPRAGPSHPERDSRMPSTRPAARRTAARPRGPGRRRTTPAARRPTPGRLSSGCRHHRSRPGRTPARRRPPRSTAACRRANQTQSVTRDRCRNAGERRPVTP